MFEGAVLAWELRRRGRARKRVYARYELLAKNASTEKDKDAVAFEQHMKINEIDDAVQQLQNNHLIRLARKYLLVIPPIDQKHASWEESEFTGKWRLTSKAFIEMRDAVRAERTARHETWQRHIVAVSAVTGLIGTLTGLISVAFFHISK